MEAIEDKLELIAAGQAVAISAGLHTSSLRPDLTAIPLRGVGPSHVVLATRVGDDNRLVAAFRTCAQTQLIGPGPVRSASGPPTRSGG